MDANLRFFAAFYLDSSLVRPEPTIFPTSSPVVSVVRQGRPVVSLGQREKVTVVENFAELVIFIHHRGTCTNPMVRKYACYRAIHRLTTFAKISINSVTTLQ